MALLLVSQGPTPTLTLPLVATLAINMPLYATSPVVALPEGV